MSIHKTNNLIFNWLKKKLYHHENGIILEDNNIFAFKAAQDFIQSTDCTFKTPVIYFEAFPGESAVKFFATLYDELASKLSFQQNGNQRSLVEIIKATSLEMIIIDKSHLQPADTLSSIVEFFARCNVVLIFISTKKKTRISGIMDHPQIAQWEQFTVLEKFYSLPKPF